MKRLQFKSFAMGALATVGGLFGIAWFADSSSSLQAGIPENLGAISAPVKIQADVSALNSAYKSVAEAVSPSVVSISVTVEREIPKMFRGMPGLEDQEGMRTQGAGSGVIVSHDGYIVTNNHVIDGALDEDDAIEVVLEDRRRYPAKIIGTDELTDLAVIKIDADDLVPAHLGEMQDVQVGQIVFAVGNPLGLSGTITQGIVSAISRGSMDPRMRGYHVTNYIQTDAAINPGNSGGGLFDINGSLVGINTAIATETGNYIGYGFSIPIDLTRAVVTDLIEDGKIDRGYIGVAISTIDDNVTAKGLGLDKVGGVLVNKIYEGSAGEEAGLKMGDVILEVDGKEVLSSNELQSIVATYRANDVVKLTISRDGEILTKEIKLKARDEDQNEFAFADTEESEDSEEWEGNYNDEKLGMEVANLTEVDMKRYDMKKGIIVKDVRPYSHADKQGLVRDMLITTVDGEEITSVGQFKRILESKKPGEVIRLIGTYSNGKQSTEDLIFLEIPS